MAHDRAGWWWQQEGCHWDPRGKKGQASVGWSGISNLGLGIISPFLSRCIFHHWIKASVTQSFFFMQQGFLLSIHVKDLHTNTHLRERAKFKLIYFHTTNPPVIHILIKHTSASFALSSAKWHWNLSWQQSKQRDGFNKIILYFSENILTVLLLFPLNIAIVSRWR